jgi:hypothetical protein
MLFDNLLNMSPDKGSIEQGLAAAKVLGDNTVAKFIRDQQERKYYDQLIASAVSSKHLKENTELVIDYSVYPYKVTATVYQQLVRTSNVKVQALIFVCTLRNTARSDQNPHGLLVENLMLKDIQNISDDNRM